MEKQPARYIERSRFTTWIYFKYILIIRFVEYVYVICFCYLIIKCYNCYLYLADSFHIDIDVQNIVSR